MMLIAQIPLWVLTMLLVFAVFVVLLPWVAYDLLVSLPILGRRRKRSCSAPTLPVEWTDSGEEYCGSLVLFDLTTLGGVF